MMICVKIKRTFLSLSACCWRAWGIQWTYQKGDQHIFFFTCWFHLRTKPSSQKISLVLDRLLRWFLFRGNKFLCALGHFIIRLSVRHMTKSPSRFGFCLSAALSWMHWEKCLAHIWPRKGNIFLVTTVI